MAASPRSRRPFSQVTCLSRLWLSCLAISLLMNNPLRAAGEAWTGQDIGAAPLPGTSSYDTASDTFVVKSAGAGIEGVVDGLRFVSVPFDGDVQLVTRVDGFSATHPWARAGIMIRQSTADNAPMASLAVTENFGIEFRVRTTTGAATQTVSSPGGPVDFVPATWLKLVRVAGGIRAYRSTDGENWIQVGLANIALGTRVQAGLAASSNNSSALATATFTKLRVSAPVFGTALFVVGSSNLNLLEQGIKTRMEQIGFAVQIATVASANLEAATGKAIVVISDTASVLVGDWSAVPTPILTWKPETFATLGLTGPTAGND
jgi:regulation of enolase protein 1 (concanavalin A-like superfamily)